MGADKRNEKRVLVLAEGGSAVYGYGDRGIGWAGNLKTECNERARLGQRPIWEVINLSLSRQTIDQIAERLPDNIRHYQERARLVGIFLVGLSDSTISRFTGEPRVSQATFEEKLHHLGKTCLENSLDVLFVTPYHVDEAKTNPLPNGDRTLNGLLDAYADSIQRIAPHYNWRVIDSGMDQYPKARVLADDGLHPNSLGHSLIYRSVLPELEEMLGSPADITPAPSVPIDPPSAALVSPPFRAPEYINTNAIRYPTANYPLFQ